DVVSVACGSSHVCVVTAGGRVSCMGSNFEGALGATLDACAPRRDSKLCTLHPPVVVAGLPKMVDVAVSGAMSCAVSEAGHVYCWGSAAWYWLSDAADRSDAALPEEKVFRVPGLEDIRRIALGSYFACALDARGDVWCWGLNEDGELGRGTHEKRNTVP